MNSVKESSTNFGNKQMLSACCVEIYAINLIAGQWTLAICCALANRKLRFGELKKAIPNVTERMLSLQLRKMEANGLLKRTVYAEVPSRVEYQLTSCAKELLPIIDQLQAWGERHKKSMK